MLLILLQKIPFGRTHTVPITPRYGGNDTLCDICGTFADRHPFPDTYCFNPSASVALCVGAAISIVCSSLLLRSYRKYTLLKQHPSYLIALRAVSDIIFCVLMFTSLNHLTDDNMNGVVDCAWYSFCRTTAFFVQASAMFSEMISFMITVDLLVAINNPFSGIQQGIRRAVVVATAMSLITAFILVLQDPGVPEWSYETCHNESEGLIEWSPGTPGWGPENAVCWYSFVGAGKANPNSICLYFSWILLSIVVSVISVPILQRRLREGLP